MSGIIKGDLWQIWQFHPCFSEFTIIFMQFDDSAKTSHLESFCYVLPVKIIVCDALVKHDLHGVVTYTEEHHTQCT